ncbi:CsbD family protein [Bdellovibrio sp. HCB2-146]|uniref:CsbD family protein n=1 Tax=Bdellovibrio sp. HCB2-146 TaxID=3394362 RepID=UPI0039BD920D
MNKDTVQGDWKIMKGKIKQAWGKLTDDQIDMAEGNLDKLEGEIQKSYGISKDEAHEKYSEWKNKINRRV